MLEVHPQDFIKCPFCTDHSISPISGKTTCPNCFAMFEIDERGECVFVDTNNLRLPAKGTVCPGCGLIQGEMTEKCNYCGAFLYSDQQ